MNKRFAVFRFHDYYPGGGWSDLHCIVTNKTEAYEKARARLPTGLQNYQIVDLNGEQGHMIVGVGRYSEAPGE